MRIGNLIAIATALGVFGLSGPALASPALGDVDDICGAATDRVERERGIPSQLLRAISRAESGRWDGARRATIAWPWTVTSGGPGRFFPSREAAIAEVRRLEAKGVRNIDVGCMQINLHYHPDAFADLDQAFDPAANVEYAARFLRELFDEARSWTQAAARYHSRDPDRGLAYQRRVMEHWNIARREAGENLREARTAAWQEARRQPQTATESSAELWNRDRFRALNEAFKDRQTPNADPAALADGVEAAPSTSVQLAQWRQTREQAVPVAHQAARDRAVRERSAREQLAGVANKVQNDGARTAGAKARFAEKRREQLSRWRADPTKGVRPDN